MIDRPNSFGDMTNEQRISYYENEISKTYDKIDAIDAMLPDLQKKNSKFKNSLLLKIDIMAKTIIKYHEDIEIKKAKQL